MFKMFKKAQSRKRGEALGYKAVELARAFMEEHNNKPPADVAARFFESLDDEGRASLNKHDPDELAGYRKVVTRYQRNYLKNLPDRCGCPQCSNPDNVTGAYSRAVSGYRPARGMSSEGNRAVVRIEPDSTPESLRDQLASQLDIEADDPALDGLVERLMTIQRAAVLASELEKLRDTLEDQKDRDSDD